jgi:hypothetical protein
MKQANEGEVVPFSQNRRALESVGCTRDVKERKRDNENKRPKKVKKGEQECLRMFYSCLAERSS